MTGGLERKRIWRNAAAVAEVVGAAAAVGVAGVAAAVGLTRVAAVVEVVLMAAVGQQRRRRWLQGWQRQWG